MIYIQAIKNIKGYLNRAPTCPLTGNTLFYESDTILILPENVHQSNGQREAQPVSYLARHFPREGIRIHTSALSKWKYPELANKIYQLIENESPSPALRIEDIIEVEDLLPQVLPHSYFVDKDANTYSIPTNYSQ